MQIKFEYGNSIYVLEENINFKSSSYLREYCYNGIKNFYIGFEGYENTLDKLMKYKYLVLGQFGTNSYFHISEVLDYDSKVFCKPESDFLINLDLITDTEFINARNIYSLLED